MEGMGMNAGFWQGRRVFLTGHTGFKGGWLSLWLQHLGAQVTGYALEADTQQPSFFSLAQVGRGMHSIIGDVRDLAFFKKILVRCRTRGGDPHGGAGLGPSVLHRPGRDVLDECHGNGSFARGGQVLSAGSGGAECHHRQML